MIINNSVCKQMQERTLITIQYAKVTMLLHYYYVITYYITVG